MEKNFKATEADKESDGGNTDVEVPLNADAKAKCICKSCFTFIKNSLVGGVFCSMGFEWENSADASM